ncbi:predicted protein [Sclerotinia sclerotiorum 1980 UF-70]|uniref:Uncharacterized protein n=1 Tax=Sclerotinia sclerotiorum (strain ATCC 18683 / 1980 / Ss-1) TaxID=665079 RepID=A7EVR0_SCLS1|nr:predicted protein [Sclerotinia sclerotiorum 1980 UF-70]EDN93552.1 predicted protein [Sclerotinia sclerotiorum 1980 UF-70]
MKYTEPIILEIPDSYMEDSRGYASAADVSGKVPTGRAKDIKHSRSPRPFSAVTDTPPPKRQMSSGSITPWITRHDTYKEVQKQLSPYGLGPYEGKVASDKWLPFSVQSKVLTRVQIVLEEALFEFLNTNFPHVCEKMDGRRWARLNSICRPLESLSFNLEARDRMRGYEGGLECLKKAL